MYYYSFDVPQYQYMLDFKKDGKITGQTILFQFDDFREAIALIILTV